jgi:thiol:disulfide interchange protein DsbC
MQAILTLTAMILALLAGSAATAQTDGVPQALLEKLVKSIEVPSQNQLEIINIEATALPSIYQVELNTGEILYSDVAGDYLFAGDMYQTTGSGLLNLSSSTRQARTVEKIAAIAEDEMIIFDPPGEVRSTITVFTDVDCTYCRALHHDMEALLDMGIRVRYLAYPRGGEAAGSFSKMISVWCSDDRQKSLTQAKNGQNLPQRDCENPVMAHYALGNELGISGTPAIIFPDGRLIPGYLDAERMKSMLGLN